MRIAVFSSRRYDEQFLRKANSGFGHSLQFIENHLDATTAGLAAGFPAICAFVNDTADAAALDILAAGGTRLIALRCAGYNNVDLKAARALGMKVLRVPAYSPYAVAEHAVALLLTLNRKTHKAYNRVRDGNFALEGLLGFDVHGRTVGIVGTGAIGSIVAQIFRGFGCRLLAHDLVRNPACETLGVGYVPLEPLLAESDIVTLHCPLTKATHYLLNRESFARMKDGVTVINTGRGALIDTEAAIEALKTGKIGYLGLDVYEEEGDLFFEDRSQSIIQDDVFMRLTTFPNVLVTGHQAFFTDTALRNIAETTLQNVTDFERGLACRNEVKASGA
jgi:D-lactate dehydrogenase